jgi:hypothetical protein
MTPPFWQLKKCSAPLGSSGSPTSKKGMLPYSYTIKSCRKIRLFFFVFVQMIDYLKTKEDFVSLLTKHMGTSAVMDLLLRLITSVESPQLRSDLMEVKTL